MLTYNKYTGEFRFYDFKTSKYRFYTDEGKLDTHYTTVWHNRQIRSTQEQYTRQLSAYNDLFTSRYGTPIVDMALIPLIINYNDKGITAFNAEPTVNITYQPSEFMQGTTVSTPKVDNNTIPVSNVKTLELSPTKKVKVDISTLPVVTTINGSEIKAYIEEVKSTNNSTKKITTFYSPYMVFPNGEVTYMNGRRELLTSEELEENKKTWASTIQDNKVAFIQEGLVNAKPQEEIKPETKPEIKTVTPVSTPINIVDNIKSNAASTGQQSAEEDLLKAMSLLNTYNKEAPDGTLGKEEIKPRTDVEEQTSRNVDGNIVVDNPEALKKWNELSKDTRDLLKLMNMNETNWNNMLPKQRESELNCLS